MTKSRDRPMAGASRRSNLAHSEWKVDTHMRLQSVPSSASTRPRISSAALLVNVTASTSFGCASPLPTRWAMRLVMTRVLPEPAPAKIEQRPANVKNSLTLLGIERLQELHRTGSVWGQRVATRR